MTQGTRCMPGVEKSLIIFYFILLGSMIISISSKDPTCFFSTYIVAYCVMK